MLGPRGARQAWWVGRCEEAFATGMRVGVGGRRARGSCSQAAGSGCSNGTQCSFLKSSGGSAKKG